MSQIVSNVQAVTWQMAVMWAIGAVMIALAIRRDWPRRPPLDGLTAKKAPFRASGRVLFIGARGMCIILLSNKTELFDHRPSGNASLPDCFFLESLRDRGTSGDFIHQTPSLGTRPQTPSSLRA